MVRLRAAGTAATTAIHRRVATLRDGGDPAVIARLESGWAVMGDPQVIAGYSLLLPDPVVPHLNALDARARAGFLADLALLGDALLEATGALRINYAMFGNAEPALHAHLFPRRAAELAAVAGAHPWALDWAAAPRWSAELHGGLLACLRAALATLRAPGAP